MNEPYIANCSSVAAFEKCRFRWICAWVLNRVPRQEPAALSEGKILHLIFEDFLTGRAPTMFDAVGARIAQAKHEGAPEKAIEGLMDRADALAQWADQYEWEIPVLEVEEAFEIVHPMDPRFRLRGRPDRVGVMQGQLWHVQNRGLAAATNFGQYIELATRHRHEHTYAVALSQKYPQYPYGGTLFNLVRKLKYRTNVGKKNEAVKTLSQMFFQHPMVIDLKGDLHDHVMRSLLKHMEAMKQTEDDFRNWGIVPPANESMNGGFNGSTIDPYFRVLTGKVDLADDTLFKDRDDLYAPLLEVPDGTGD
jgi:hypothetical protein